MASALMLESQVSGESTLSKGCLLGKDEVEKSDESSCDPDNLIKTEGNQQPKCICDIFHQCLVSTNGTLPDCISPKDTSKSSAGEDFLKLNAGRTDTSQSCESIDLIECQKSESRREMDYFSESNHCSSISRQKEGSNTEDQPRSQEKSYPESRNSTEKMDNVTVVTATSINLPCSVSENGKQLNNSDASSSDSKTVKEKESAQSPAWVDTENCTSKMQNEIVRLSKQNKILEKLLKNTAFGPTRSQHNERKVIIEQGEVTADCTQNEDNIAQVSKETEKVQEFECSDESSARCNTDKRSLNQTDKQSDKDLCKSDMDMLVNICSVMIQKGMQSTLPTATSKRKFQAPEDTDIKSKKRKIIDDIFKSVSMLCQVEGESVSGGDEINTLHKAYSKRILPGNGFALTSMKDKDFVHHVESTFSPLLSQEHKLSTDQLCDSIKEELQLFREIGGEYMDLNTHAAEAEWDGCNNKAQCTEETDVNLFRRIYEADDDSPCTELEQTGEEVLDLSVRSSKPQNSSDHCQAVDFSTKTVDVQEDLVCSASKGETNKHICVKDKQTKENSSPSGPVSQENRDTASEKRTTLNKHVYASTGQTVGNNKKNNPSKVEAHFDDNFVDDQHRRATALAAKGAGCCNSDNTPTTPTKSVPFGTRLFDILTKSIEDSVKSQDTADIELINENPTLASLLVTPNMCNTESNSILHAHMKQPVVCTHTAEEPCSCNKHLSHGFYEAMENFTAGKIRDKCKLGDKGGCQCDSNFKSNSHQSTKNCCCSSSESSLLRSILLNKAAYSSPVSQCQLFDSHEMTGNKFMPSYSSRNLNEKRQQTPMTQLATHVLKQSERMDASPDVEIIGVENTKAQSKFQVYRKLKEKNTKEKKNKALGQWQFSSIVSPAMSYFGHATFTPNFSKKKNKTQQRPTLANSSKQLFDQKTASLPQQQSSSTVQGERKKSSFTVGNVWKKVRPRASHTITSESHSHEGKKERRFQQNGGPLAFAPIHTKRWVAEKGDVCHQLNRTVGEDDTVLHPPPPLIPITEFFSCPGFRPTPAL